MPTQVDRITPLTIQGPKHLIVNHGGNKNKMSTPAEGRVLKSKKAKHLKGAGHSVKCPSCCGVFHKTTDLFDSNVRPNGAFVELITPWNGWGWQAFDGAHATNATLCSQMNCPGCTAPLAPSGRLLIVEKRKRKPKTVSEMNNKKSGEEVRLGAADLDGHDDHCGVVAGVS